MKKKTVFVYLLLPAVLAISLTFSQAALAYECRLIDDFTLEVAQAGNLLFGQTNLTNWTVTSGNVDVIGIDTKDYNYFPAYGRYIDLSGSAPGTMTLKTPISLGPGQYTLVFDLAGSRRSQEESAAYRVFGGSLDKAGAITLPQTAPFTSFFVPFELAVATDILISFASGDADNNGYLGLLLDNVRVCEGAVAPVPIPASLLLLGSGLLRLAAYRRRKQG